MDISRPYDEVERVLEYLSREEPTIGELLEMQTLEMVCRDEENEEESKLD